jgi:hypothetical protein
MVTSTDSSAWAPGPGGVGPGVALTADGWQLRRERNREAVVDAPTSFESCQLLLGAQGLSPARARTVVGGALAALFGPSKAAPGTDRA